jgi:Transcriptional Coactivator p15 (PC4)
VRPQKHKPGAPQDGAFETTERIYLKLDSGNGNVAGTNAKAGSEITPAFVITKNRFDEIWAYVQPYGRHDLAHLRIFTVSEDDEMIPTKRGISIHVKDLPKLAEAVAALVSAVEGPTK